MTDFNTVRQYNFPTVIRFGTLPGASFVGERNSTTPAVSYS